MVSRVVSAEAEAAAEAEMLRMIAYRKNGNDRVRVWGVGGEWRDVIGLLSFIFIRFMRQFSLPIA